MVRVQRGCGKLTSCRWVLAYLAFFGFCIVYLLRVNLSVALLAMTKHHKVVKINQTECPATRLTNASEDNRHKTNEPQYDWDIDLQGQIIGSFFYGYLGTQILGGWMATIYGGKKIFGVGVLCTAVLTLLTPLAARNVNALIAVRVLEGLGEGVTFPSMHALWAKWAPPPEKSNLVSFAVAGAPFGTIIGLPMSGLIVDTLGWEWVFYIFGAVSCVWFVLWMLIISDSPSTHKRISVEEKIYIISEIEKTRSSSEPVSFRNTPWLAIARSPAVWAIIVVHFSNNWFGYTLLTCLPRFLDEVLRFNLADSSFLSALPSIFTWLAIWFGGYIVDVLRERKLVSTIVARKTSLGIGMVIPAICLIGTGYVGCSHIAVVSLLCIAGGLNGISQANFNVTHLDIAPKYAGTLLGISNTFATIPGFLAPLVVSWLINAYGSNTVTWRYVFYISAAIYVVGWIVFMIFGRAQVQPWAQSRSSNSDNDRGLLIDPTDDEKYR